MKFKFKNTLLVSFFAIAGILGVSSALINKQINHEPVAEKAEAATTGGHIYIDFTAYAPSDLSHVYIHYWGSSSSTTWPGTEMTKLTDKIYYTSIPSGDTTSLIFHNNNGWRSTSGDAGATPVSMPSDLTTNNTWKPKKNTSSYWTISYPGDAEWYTHTVNEMPQYKLIAVNNFASNWITDATIGVYCWGASYSGKVLPVTVLTDHLAYFEMPSGVSCFKVLRLHDISLPYDGYPDNSKIHNAYNDKYISANNVIVVTGWGTGNIGMDAFKTFIKSGTTILIDGSANSWWLSSDAKQWIYYFLDSEYYGVSSSNGWKECSVAKTGKYVYWVADQDYVIDGFDFCRVNKNKTPDWSGSDNVWNQTKDIKINDGFFSNLINISTSSENGKYKWTIGDNDATALAFGEIFNACVVCTGAGSISTDNWNTAKAVFEGLRTDVQNIAKYEVENPSGTQLQKAVSKYDYILFYKRYAGKTDYIGRQSLNVNSYGTASSFSPFSFLGNNENNYSTLIIVIASSVALLSVTALSILVIRKRKTKEQ